MTTGIQRAAATGFDANDANGQACRLYLPPPKLRKPSMPVIMYCHPHANDPFIFPGYFAYTLAHAVVQQGWAWIGPNMHGSVWANAQALGDMTAARTLVGSLVDAGPTVLLGASMGGTAVANAVSHGSVPGVVGAYTIDGAMSLATMYASANYTGGIKTAYGIASDGSDYAAKTAGYDPLLRPAADLISVPWRMVASPNDTIVVKGSHTDPFAAKIAAAPEHDVVTHYGGHISATAALPADLVAFVKRCLAR